MLLFVYTTTHKRFVIFTCRYFKLSWNTTALSQSNCRNFSCSSINVKIQFDLTMCIVLLQERQNILQQDSERAGSSSKYQDDVRVNILVPVLIQWTENISSFSSFCSVIGCGECSIEVNVGLNRCKGGGGTPDNGLYGEAPSERRTFLNFGCMKG